MADHETGTHTEDRTERTCKGPSLLLLLAALAALVVSGWAMIGPFSVEFLAAVDLGWVLVGAALLIGAVLVFLPNRRR
ncbi:membrane protein [Rhodococcus pyridinivorans SB3094]|uniref:Membrane protein n=1 Tax=Rhodococcus pyridinivorans SB3094 TaxID=1435356 RepID=V9XE43_9NOCA|nr:MULTISPECIES: hypothetical protein [Rhodococcus]AHD20653.1 membrane protein [Rhodococcus pyridinivorans SB3094]MCT7292334.1 hypothetical protein [Rhodococcus sp. PAE-6]